jgi:hypothetical protein
MLDDLAVLKPEEVNDCEALIGGRAPRMDMCNEEVALGDDAFNLSTQLRELCVKPIHVLADTLNTVADGRIVLDVAGSEMHSRGLEVRLIYRLLKKIEHDLLIRRNGRFILIAHTVYLVSSWDRRHRCAPDVSTLSMGEARKDLSNRLNQMCGAQNGPWMP